MYPMNNMFQNFMNTPAMGQNIGMNPYGQQMPSSAPGIPAMGQNIGMGMYPGFPAMGQGQMPMGGPSMMSQPYPGGPSMVRTNEYMPPQGQPMPQQQPTDWRRYGLNDQQRGRVQDMRQAYRGMEGGMTPEARADLQQMKQNMQMRNAGFDVARGQGRNTDLRDNARMQQQAAMQPQGGMQAPGSVGMNEASMQGGYEKVQGGRDGRRGMAGSRPGRTAQARQNKRRNR